MKTSCEISTKNFINTLERRQSSKTDDLWKELGGIRRLEWVTIGFDDYVASCTWFYSSFVHL